MSLATILTTSVPGDWAILLLRWVIGLALLPYAVQKICTPSMAEKFPAVLGLSSSLSFHLAMCVETLASVCLLLGLGTRIAAVAGICNMSVAFKVNHGPYLTAPSAPFLLGFIAVLVTGPGRFALDALLWG
ncbi:MAG: DoxX family protein [Desulfovibrio sp.]|nr:DoxX family protein [Desulfovibrio sp.]